MTIQSATELLRSQLETIYDLREAQTMVDWVMEKVMGWKKIDRLLQKQSLLNARQINQFTQIKNELMLYKPIQYVLGEAWFDGHRFLVNEHTLIPRPETEELVAWIHHHFQESAIHQASMLDIGTGTGCIPISLQKRLPAFTITAIDISAQALTVAASNARQLDAPIRMLQLDILQKDNWQALGQFDCIVSNPPYIARHEESSMAKHVVAYEPSIALFVPDEDPLLFYRTIAEFANTHLNPKGWLFFEINEALGKETVALLESAGYAVTLQKDLQQRDRMICATKLLS